MSGDRVKNVKRDYHTVHLNPRQKILCPVGGAAVGLLVSLVFARSMAVSVLLAAAGAMLLPVWYRHRLLEKQKNELSRQFKDALYELLAAVRAGRSLEGAFEATFEDMDRTLMPYMYEEWHQIIGQVKVGVPVEASLMDFAKRSGVPEVYSFARSIEVCKRSEGNLARIMDSTIRVLQERMEIQSELKVMLARKKLEQRIMSASPLLIVGMLVLMAPDYLSPLYQTTRGRLIMLICAGLSVISFFVASRMVRIEI